MNPTNANAEDAKDVVCDPSPVVEFLNRQITRIKQENSNKFEYVWLCPSDSEKFHIEESQDDAEGVLKMLRNIQLRTKPQVYVRSCSGCSSKFKQEAHPLRWLTYEFCNRKCLYRFQCLRYSVCNFCPSKIDNVALGKYSISCGSDLLQFCSFTCFTSCKKQLRVCTTCHTREVNGLEWFVVPNRPYKTEDFCNRKCLERYLQRHCYLKPRCLVCNKEQANAESLKVQNIIYKFCSSPCFSSYLENNNFNATLSLCDCCHTYFLHESKYLFCYGNTVFDFCSDACQKIMMYNRRKRTSCQYCHMCKYDFDMIRTTENNQIYCSVNCLNLHVIDSCNVCKALPFPTEGKRNDFAKRKFCSYRCASSFADSGASIKVISCANKRPNQNEIAEQGKKIRVLPTQRNIATSCKPCGRSVATSSIPETSNKSIQYEEMLQTNHVTQSDADAASLENEHNDSIPKTTNKSTQYEEMLQTKRVTQSDATSLDEHNDSIPKTTNKSTQYEEMLQTKHVTKSDAISLDEHNDSIPKTTNKSTQSEVMLRVSSVNQSDTISPENKHNDNDWDANMNQSLCLDTFNNWAAKTILQMAPNELNDHLALFVRQNKKSHPVDEIFYVCLSIQLHLIKNGRNDNVFLDEYSPLTGDLDRALREASHPKGRIKEKHLWETHQLGTHSPLGLVTTLLYFNTKYFKLKTVEDHLNVSFRYVLKHFGTNERGENRTVLRYYPKDLTDDRFEQEENNEDKLKCPVRLYEFYLSKCPDGVAARDDLYYLMPERTCVPDSPAWFRDVALSSQFIRIVLNRFMLVEEIGAAFENVCNV